MSVRMDFEDALYELEQTTATLGFIQTAFAEGDSLIEAGESSAGKRSRAQGRGKG